MIPHKLRLSNFMCYREEQSLDFSGIHLACLTGDNGHGKSALLDAITWALWGRARPRRDDELIALGENEVWVELEFGLGPQRYRVWRQRSKKGRGQSDLHFYVWDANGADGGDWQLLDDGGLVERQAQIIRTLRLDYETFVNSAFLLQGRADSFTVKTASERKQILADILGLGRYDLYEERAKQEAQARREQATRMAARSQASTPSCAAGRLRGAAPGCPCRGRPGRRGASHSRSRTGRGAARRAGAPFASPSACRFPRSIDPLGTRSGRWPRPTRHSQSAAGAVRCGSGAAGGDRGRLGHAQHHARR